MVGELFLALITVLGGIWAGQYCSLYVEAGTGGCAGYILYRIPAPQDICFLYEKRTYRQTDVSFWKRIGFNSIWIVPAFMPMRR